MATAWVNVAPLSTVESGTPVANTAGSDTATSNVLEPGQTTYGEEVDYRTHDLTAQLRQGENFLRIDTGSGAYQRVVTPGRFFFGGGLEEMTTYVKPKVLAPWHNKAGTSACWAAVRRGGRPERDRCCSASAPSWRACVSHWLTALSLTPSAVAIWCCRQPIWNNSQARRRRPSRQVAASFVVGRLMPRFYPNRWL